MRVVVCDPGVGNVRSLVRALERVSAGGGVGAGGGAGVSAGGFGKPYEVVVSREAPVVRGADYVVVPGQGAFGPFARGIEGVDGQGGLGDALREHIAAGRPYLGICLGMQILFASSDEAPGARGLGVLEGHVARLAPGVDPATKQPRVLPHIGWNSVEPSEAGPWHGQPARHFYFANSFAARPTDPAIVAGTTTYGDDRFTSAVVRGNVRGVQFHPEKSQHDGLALLASFFRS